MTRLRSCLLNFLISLTLTVLLFGNTISPAAVQDGKTSPQDPRPGQQVAPSAAPQASSVETPQATGEDEGDDPDLPAITGGAIDKTTYLQLRDEHIGRLRGIDPSDPDTPRDPRMRMNAIRTLEGQEGKLDRSRIRSKSQAITSGISPLSPISSPSATIWTPVGPDPIPNGPTNAPVGTLVPVSGRVTAIAVHPTNPDVVYVGTAGGGVYRSLDRGLSWTPLMDSALTLVIGAITIDPVNPSTIFVGTGEGDRTIDSFFGIGIYRIDNADTNPVLLGPFETRVAGTGTTAANGHAFLGTAITKIIVDPTDDNRIFVGNTVGNSGLGGLAICCNRTNPPSGSLGLHFSGNAMSANPTFSLVAIAPTDPSAAVTDVVMEPGNRDNLLVGVEDLLAGNPNSGIYRITNASAASQSPSLGPTITETLSLAGQLLNIKLAMNKVGNVTTTLAATAANSGTLLASPDGGITWPTTIAPAAGFCSAQCFYDMVVTLKPDDPNTFFLGGQAGASTLKKTMDGGRTFTTPNATLHADTHAIVYAPSNLAILYEGSDGGIWNSGDSGNTWISRNTPGFSATQFESVALHPLDREFMIGGTQDNGTEFKQPDGSWLRVDGGDGGHALIDQNATDTTNVTMYHTYFNAPVGSNLPNQIGYAHHTGSLPGSWLLSGCFGGISRNGINCTDNVLFYAPMAEGPGNPSPVYFGSDRLYRSADGGVSNILVSQAPIMVNPATGLNLRISAIAISPQDDNTRMVGLESGGVLATTTGSSTLTNITGALPLHYVAHIVIDPNNKATAYITFDSYFLATGQHVWKTNNLIDPSPVWTPAGSGIPNVPTNSIAIDPLSSNSLYVATDIGVYHSSDGGATWNPYGTGLPRVACFDIAVQSPNRVLRVATHGRGLWEIAAELASTTTSVTSSLTPSAFGQPVTFTAIVGAQVGTPTGTVQFMDGDNALGTPVTLSGGSATFTTAALSVGMHTITAIYSGDGLYGTSTGSLGTQGVNQAASTTTVASSTNDSVFGQAVTFTATVSAVAPGSAMATGTIQFMDGEISLGQSFPLNGGSANLTIASLSVGTHSITAIYGGDANLTGSAGSAPPKTVDQAASASTVTSSANPSVFEQAVTFMATVSAVTPGSGVAAGTIQFTDGGVNLGPPISLNGSFAALTISSLSSGTHNITAVYAGDANFTGSTGLLPIQTVVQAGSSVAISSSSNPENFGQAVTFTALASSPAGVPTGAIQFMDGSGTLGAPVILSGGVASLSTSSLTVGVHSIIAQYSGDINFSTGTSLALQQIVHGTDVAVTLMHHPRVAAIHRRLTFMAVVTNHGPESANVTLAEQLTGDFALLKAMPSSGSCTIVNQQVSCSLGSIPNGGTVTVRVILIPKHPGNTLEATVTATPDIGETVTGNNTATDRVQVKNRQPDDDDRDGDHHEE